MQEHDESSWWMHSQESRPSLKPTAETKSEQNDTNGLCTCSDINKKCTEWSENQRTCRGDTTSISRGGKERGWWRWCHPRTATPEISSKGKRGASYRTMEQATQARVKYRYAAYQPFLQSLTSCFPLSILPMSLLFDPPILQVMCPGFSDWSSHSL